MTAEIVGVGVLIVQVLGLLIVIIRGSVRLENRLARIETLLSVCPHVGNPPEDTLYISVPNAGRVEERIKKLIASEK